MVLYSLYYAIVGYSYGSIDSKIYGIDAFLEVLIEKCWMDNFIPFNVIGLILIICIVYQIWYFIQKKRHSKKLNIRFVLFILSISCWAIYFLLGVYSFFFGYNVGIINSHVIYGIEALKNCLLMNLIAYSFIPILPISFIYIIVYLFRNRRK